MTQEFPMNPGEGRPEQIIYGVSVENSQNVTFNQTQIIQISVEEVKTRRFIIASPYKGLKKFEPEDKDRFFGRDQFLTGLVNELEQTNFVLLLGASGSGKSSVIRAGLIPWLAERKGNQMVKLIFSPDIDPFQSLYASLLGKYTQSEAQIALITKEDTLTQVVRSLKRQDSYWLILIDQFEELFNNTSQPSNQPSKHDIFIASLVQLIKTLDRAGDRSVKVIATMRTDFLDRLSPYPALVKATDKHRPMIAEMQLDELRLAIEQPAAHHGVVFEEGLVKHIIDDVQRQAGYLPLLQYTLDLLWDIEVQSQSIEDRTLNINNYLKLGGVRGALQQHVDQIYNALSKPEKLAAQRIFLKLVGVGQDEESGTDWKPVRRRANRSEFSDPVEKDILTRLIDQNLLVSNRANDAQESSIELAHEALLTAWKTLNTWIKENRQAIFLRNRLNDDVSVWQSKKVDDELWTGSKLEKALELRNDSTFKDVLGGFSEAANQFINASAGRRDRQRRRTMIGSISFSTVALSLALLAVCQGYRADQQRLTAEADALGISALRDFESGSGEIESLLKAIQAGQGLKALVGNSQTVETYPTKSPVFALQKILDSIHEKNRFDSDFSSVDADSTRVNDVSISRNGEQIAIVRRNGNVEIWDRNGQRKSWWQAHKNWADYVSFSPDGKHIATMGGDGWVRLWDTQSQHKLAEFGGQRIVFARKDNILGMSSNDFSNEPKHFSSVIVSHNVQEIALATVDTSGKIQLWSWLGKLITPLKDHKGIAKSIIFDPTGQHVATVENDDSVQLWSTAGEPLTKLEKVLDVEDARFKSQEFTLHNVSFSPDGKSIATIGKDQVVRVWNLQGNKITQLEGTFSSILFAPDGKYIFVKSSNNPLQLWSLLTSKPVADFNPSMGIDRIIGSNGLGVPFYKTFSPDSQRFAVIGTVGRIAILDWSGHELAWLKVFNQPFVSASPSFRYGVVFSPDWKYLVAGTSSNQFKLWNLSKQQLTKWTVGKVGITKTVFTPDRQYLATVTENNEVQLRDIYGKTVANWGRYKGEVKAIFFSPEYSNTQYIATVEGDGKVKVWDPSGKLIRELNTTLSKAAWDSVSFSLDGSQIAVVDNDNTVSLWSTTDSSNPLAKWATGYSPGREGFVYSQSHSPNLRYVATAGQDGKAQIFDIRENKTILLQGHGHAVQLQGHEGIVKNITFSPDGQYVATAGGDGTARLWDISGRELHSFLHQNPVTSISFHPNSQFLATSDSANIVRIWTLLGTQIAEFKGDVSVSYEGKVTFSSDGKKIILMGSTVEAWKFEGLNELLVRGCNWLKDYLTYNPNVPENRKHICDEIR